MHSARWKWKKKGDALDLMVFLAAALSRCDFLVSNGGSFLNIPQYFCSGWSLFSWKWSFPFNTNLCIVVTTFEEKSGVWSSFHWSAMFKIIWTNLAVFAHFKMNLQKLFLQALSRLLLHFDFLERKNLFAKIDLTLKYVVLWHNSLNIDGHYHIPKLCIFHFSPY